MKGFKCEKKSERFIMKMKSLIQNYFQVMQILNAYME